MTQSGDVVFDSCRCYNPIKAINCTSNMKGWKWQGKHNKVNTVCTLYYQFHSNDVIVVDVEVYKNWCMDTKN